MAVDARLRAAPKRKSYGVKPKAKPAPSRGPQGLAGPRSAKPTAGVVRARRQQQAKAPVKYSPTNKAPAFRPISSQAKPFKVQKARSRRAGFQAQKKLPASSTLKRFPALKKYTPAQKKIIAKSIKATPLLYSSSNRVERQYLTALKKKGVKLDLHPKKLRDLTERELLTKGTPAELKAAGFSSSFLDKAAKLPITGTIGVGKSLAATGVAAYHDPIGVPVKTAKGGLKMLKAAPSGIVNSIAHPAKAAESFVDDETKRHSQSFKAQVRRIRKEGAAPELLDAAGLASVGGATVGRVLVKAGARRGSKFVVAERPRLRESGGVVRAQKKASTPGRLAAQRSHDYLRARKLKKTARKVDRVEPANPIHVEALKHGEVVRLRPQKVDRTLAKAVAKTKSVAVHRMKGEQSRIVDRSVGRALAKLNKHERRAFYYVGTGQAPATREGLHAYLGERMKSIQRARAEDGVEPRGLLKRTDETKTIPKIDVDKIDYAKLRDTVRGLHDIAHKVAIEDPALNLDQILTRRYAQQAGVLGLHRGELPEPPKERIVAEPTGKHGNGDFMGDADLEATWGLRKGEPDAVAERKINGGDRVAFEKYDDEGKLVGRLVFDVNGRGPENLDVVVHSTLRRRGIASELYRAAEKAGFDVRNGATSKRSAEGAAFREALDSRGSNGVPPMRFNGEESVADFVKRVEKAANEKGLERPLYFPSERYDMDLQPDHASRAVGGVRGVRGPQRYEGKNFRLGIQDTSPQVYLTGLSRNLKRKHNWRLVTQLAEDHALGDLRGTAKGVRQAAMERGYDPKDYVLWNPRVFRQRMEHLESDAPDLQAELADVTPEKYTVDALAKSRDASGQYAEDPGWIAIPRKAWKEIEDSAKPSGVVGRSYDILKGKQSRLMLGALNIPWLQYQVLSNAMIGGVAMRGAFLDIPRSVKWYRSLDDASKEEANALLGAGTTHDIATPHLGATANNRVVAGYRAFKDWGGWDAKPIKVKGHGPSLRSVNPIEASFAVDRAQNALFKRAVLYNHLKREAFDRMGANMSIAQRLQGRAVHALTLRDPRRAMDDLMHDPETLVRHAETVNDWLGDYTTYTAAERKVFARVPMFYGFMRYSLKFVFYTMPVKHPVETAIIGKLGQLQADEIEDLLGGKGLPWSFGKLYLDKDGKLHEIDFSRANPALNTITQSFTDKGSSWVGILPPIFVSLGEQMPGVGGRKFWADRPWNVAGKSGKGRTKLGEYTVGQRLRVFTDEMLGLAAPYRIGETLKESGPQGDDSLLFSQRPLSYSNRTRKGRALNRAIKQQEDFDQSTESLINELMPLLPRPSNDVEAQKYHAAIDKAAKPLPKTKKAYGAKGSGGGYFGASKSKSKYFGASKSKSKYFGAGG